MRGLLAVAAIEICTLALSAQDPFTTGSVSGRILDPDTLAPLAGVRVGSREIGYVVTDQDGRYRFQGLKPGRLSFTIPSGYMQNPWPNKIVTVIAGRDITSDFRYRLDAQFSGRVLDEDGNPVVGVHVMAITQELGPDGEMTYRAAGDSFSPATDDRGSYVIKTGVRSGRSYYLLAFHLKSYANPISDAPADPSARARTPAATFHPSADSIATAIPIVPRSLEKQIVDIRMLKKPGYCLEATLMVGSKPSQVKFLLSEDVRYTAQLVGSTGRLEGGTSGPDGKIRLCDLPSGRYRLVVISETTNPPEYFNTVPITIVDRDVRDLTISALPLATVSGEVAWDNNPPSDPALQKVALRIGLDPDWVAIRGADAVIPSPFSLKAVPALGYRVTVSYAQRPTLYVKDIIAGTSSVRRRPYVPGSESLHITMGHDGSMIRAVVESANAQPAIHSAVIVFPREVQSEAELAATMVEGLTDDNGAFLTRPLQPGRYVVMATDDPPPYDTIGSAGEIHIQRSPEALSRILRARSRGQTVELAPRTTIQVTLAPRILE